MSVDMLVRELHTEPYDPILLYKPQGITDPTLPAISKDGFVLALQTEFQRHMYHQYAPTLICIDSTHKTNAYDFKLVTLMVVDNYGEGDYSIVNLMCVLSMTHTTTSNIHLHDCTSSYYILHTCIDGTIINFKKCFILELLNSLRITVSHHMQGS